MFVYDVMISSCLVFAALTELEAGQDLALDGRHPGVPLLRRVSLKVPRLAGAGHHQEVKVVLV